MTDAGRLRWLVTDAVPMNGGDELLLRALLRSIARRWPDTVVTVMTHDVEAARRILPQVRFVGDLASDPAAAADAYATADLVVSMPGGFLNRHYDFSRRLEGFHTAHAAGKPLALFAQSIGPFADDDQRRRVGAALRPAALVAARDGASLRYLADCGVQGDRVVEVPDAAFLWPPRPRGVRRLSWRVALCLRRWPRSDRTAYLETVRKARRLIACLAEGGLKEFVLVSTCQGFPGYVDDGDLSRRVHAGLPPDLGRRTMVHDAHLSPDAFMTLVGSCDLFIGMRLHGCLMAMLAGTPALGLAYEQKTPEIFEQLGFGEWQVPFTRNSARWCNRAMAMLEVLPALRAELPARLAAQAARAELALDRLDVLVRDVVHRRGEGRHANTH